MKQFIHHRNFPLPIVILSEVRRQPDEVEGPYFGVPAKQASRGIFTTDHKYWTYIMASRTGTLYIGITNNIERRVREHKTAQFEGFSSKYQCDRLVYYERFDDVLTAIDREKQLKGWRRAKKIALIESTNPRWEDLAEKWGWKMAFAGESIKAR